MLDLGLFALRVVVGLTFAAHGAQKAFGWWGGPGPLGWRAAVERMGFRPVELFVALSVGAELVGGLCFAAGLATPVAATVLIAQSIVIIAQAHWSKGFFSTKGGYEFALLLGVASAAVLLAGAGAWSLDALLGLPFPDPIRAGLLPLALAGGFAAHLVPRAPAPVADDAPTPAAKVGRTELRRG